MAAGAGAELQRMLQDCGLEVFRVESCLEARKVLSFKYQMSAVFTAREPGGECYRELVEAAHGRKPPLPVVACLNGGGREETAEGAAHVLAAPFEPEQVRRVVDSLLGSAYEP